MKSILEKLNKNQPLRVYRLPEGGDFIHNNHLLDLNHSGILSFPGENFEFSDDPKDCDLIAVLPCEDNIKNQYEFFKENFNGQALLLLKLYHVEEPSVIKDTYNRYKEEFHEYSDRIIPIHMELSSTEGVYYDWLWNQQKAAFTDTSLYVNLYRNSEEGNSPKMYELDEIIIPTGKHKILCANRLRRDDFSDRSVRRLALNEFLKGKDAMVNDPEMKNRFLSQEDLIMPEAGFGSFHPIHNLYYRSTYVSTYVETLTHINTNDGLVTRCVTEKTFNPLIKGHYILPFGYQGLIKDIQSYGFRLPEWIDYSYDEIEDTSLRFHHYMMGVEKIMETPLEELQNLFRRDLDMLLENRNLFFIKPYSNMYVGIKVYLQKMADNKNKIRFI